MTQIFTTLPIGSTVPGGMLWELTVGISFPLAFLTPRIETFREEASKASFASFAVSPIKFGTVDVLLEEPSVYRMIQPIEISIV